MSAPGGIPDGLAEDVERLFGDPGRAWLATVPAILDRAARDWALALDGPPRHGAHGLVVPVRQAGIAFALKIAYPDETTALEIAGLRAWDGHGTVRLVDAIPSDGAVLMERLDAGRDLTSLPIDEAIREAGRLTRRLAIAPPVDAAFASTAGRATEIASTLAERWDHLGRPFPPSRLERTVPLAKSLARSDSGRMATWDLHSENVLWGDRAGWTMIDPMPLTGDPEVALAPFLWTRVEEIAGPGHLQQLLQGYVAFGALDAARTWSWLTVRLADYWLWGLDIGLTIDPQRCRTLLDWLAQLSGR